MAQWELHPELLALHPGVLPQYRIHVPHASNEELAPHAERAHAQGFMLNAYPNHQGTWKPQDAL